jgi:hypothetical protein
MRFSITHRRSFASHVLLVLTSKKCLVYGPSFFATDRLFGSCHIHFDRYLFSQLRQLKRSLRVQMVHTIRVHYLCIFFMTTIN